MYYAYAVDNATQVCFLFCHEIRPDPSKWQVTLVLFQSNLQSAKSESEYPTIKFNGTSLGYYNPTSILPFNYFRILLFVLNCELFITINMNINNNSNNIKINNNNNNNNNINNNNNYNINNINNNFIIIILLIIFLL